MNAVKLKSTVEANKKRNYIKLCSKGRRERIKIK